MKTVRIKTWAALTKEFGISKQGDIQSFVRYLPTMEDNMPTTRNIEVTENIDGMHWKTPNETFRITNEMIDTRKEVSNEEKNLNNTRQLIKRGKDIQVSAKVNNVVSWDINVSLSDEEINTMLLNAIDNKINSL